MYLEHLNLVVSDIPKSLSFYQAAMPHWRIRGGGESVWHGAHRNWVHFGDDYHYLSLNDSGTGVNRDLVANNIGLAHFAYIVNDLDGLVKRLNDAGFEVRVWGGNQPYAKSAYFIDPDGYEVEFVEYLSDIPSERNQYV